MLGDVDGYSNDFRNLVGSAGIPAASDPGGLGFADPPVHTRLRHLLTPEFTLRRLTRLAPRIDAIVAQRLDAMTQARGPVDLVQAFARPIPAQVICELLGVPYEDRGGFQQWRTTRYDLGGGADASLGAMSRSLADLRTVIEQQRTSSGDGLLGMIITEHGDQVDDHELVGLADGVLTGGFETTASMLALGARILLQDPAAFRLMHDDDASIIPLVEELLRYLSVVQSAFPRFARHDQQLAGSAIARGDMVVCSLSGANRDEDLGTGMDSFTPTGILPRTWPSATVCIGAELARMELRAAYPALVRRVPAMRLYVDPNTLVYPQTSLVDGVDSLPVLLR